MPGYVITTIDEAYGEVLTQERAKREIEKHSLLWEDFVSEVGLKDSYTGKEVLDWLGY